jgi:anti-anti-sigma factor
MPICAEISESDGIAAIRLSGDLTVDAMREIENLFSKLGARGANRVLLDLARVRKVEIHAVAILVGIVVALRASGGELRIINAGSGVLDILGTRHFRRFFGVSSSLEKALQLLTKHNPCRFQRRDQAALVANLA